MSIFEGSPAYKKGLRRGDIIARIGEDDAKGWTSEQAVARLKGPKGTTVNISLRRRGYEGLLDLEVERDEVNITTVRGAFMIDKETGYVKLADFSETSNDEVGKALEDLKARGMKRLVFDLRDNPGGPLDQAIRISNRFVPRGELIVYTRGRVRDSDVDYRAEEVSEYTDVPLVVLVNRNSASASEIVSGAHPGSRSRPGRRRDDVRQGARAVGLQDQRVRRPGADDRPLLHAERPNDSASVGRQLRRVPHLHASRSERAAAAPGG